MSKYQDESLDSINRIAKAYYNERNYDLALEHYEKLLDIKEKVFGKSHSDTASTYNDIALVYNKKGDYNKALEFYTKALASYEKVLGKEHPYTATIYNNIAQAYNDIGNYYTGWAFSDGHLTISEAVYLSKDHYDQALEFYTKALAGREKVLGKEHPDTATTYYNLGYLYHCQVKYDQASDYYKKSYVIRKKVLGKAHPLTKQTLNDMARAYEKSGNPEPFEAWLKKNLSESE